MGTYIALSGAIIITQPFESIKTKEPQMETNHSPPTEDAMSLRLSNYTIWVNRSSFKIKMVYQ